MQVCKCDKKLKSTVKFLPWKEKAEGQPNPN